jgi:hypothetical protein
VYSNFNKGNAKRGVSPRLKIRPCNRDLWPWKSTGFQILLRSKYVPSLVNIHWRMSILQRSQGCYAVKIWPGDIDLWPRKSIGFQTLIRTKYLSSLVNIHWRILILKYSQGCYMVQIWPGDIDLWPRKSIGFQTLIRTKYLPSLVKIHWRILILVFTRMLCGKNLTPWPLTLKINRVPDSHKDYVCTKIGQNPLKNVDSRMFTRMLHSKNLTRRHWPLTLKINRVPDSPKD